MNPIGYKSIIHSHNTFPSVAQALKCPMWKVPDIYLDLQSRKPEYLIEKNLEVNRGNFGRFRAIKDNYQAFANDFISRTEVL